jgi:HEAT repeat protein
MPDQQNGTGARSLSVGFCEAGSASPPRHKPAGIPTSKPMVRVMPNQNSVLGLQRATRALFASVLCVLVVLGAAGSAFAQTTDPPSSDDWFTSIFSTYGIIIFLVVLLVGILVLRKVRARNNAQELAAAKSDGRTSRSRPVVASTTLAQDTPSSDSLVRSPAPQSLDKSQPAEYEASAYGAYRVDQEVGKLVLGKPHRMDVMASRVADDRRAIEASLVKALDSHDSGETGRRRAREALEEYGFVARQSASMLLGRDAWERSSAARTLGQIGSPSSLTFLIEALHDPDSVVRNQAVSSLGALKMPAAIGALLDIARRHSDIPASLLSETLSACSVESLGYLDSPSNEPALLGNGAVGAELFDLEPFATFEDLPAGDEDLELTEVLGQLETANESERARLVRQLGAHHAQRSVSTLSSIALNDLDPGVRSAAVTSLGAINHESVFAPVLTALADESREVRAAAARTLTSLHFDRADAYVRVTETADPETLRRVARACISTGIIAQAVDRLASEDRHQAYEAFSLFTLLARANEIEPIIDAIENHKDEEARLCAVRVLNLAAAPEMAAKLREIIASQGIPENVRTAVLEVLYKLDQELLATEPQVTTTP